MTMPAPRGLRGPAAVRAKGTAMTPRERFRATMHYGVPDRVPCFEEGMREEVLQAWQRQGLPVGADLGQWFHVDRHEEIMLNLDPRPALERLPASPAELAVLRQRLDADDPGRFPPDWTERVRAWRTREHVLFLRVNRGFFLSLGVQDWRGFVEAMYLLADDPEQVRRILAIYGDFWARLAARVLDEVDIDAAVVSEPIGSRRPLISPQVYEELVLPSYQPVLDVLARRGVDLFIWRTYANARALLPAVIRRGFNCLWVCDVNAPQLAYPRLRREFGRGLRFLGGVNTEALRRGKAAIRREIRRKVPGLAAAGGYVPFANGRIREDVPYAHYAYYRHHLEAAAARGR